MRWFALLFIVPLCATLEHPWVGEPILFETFGAYSYGSYPNVADSTSQTPYRSTNQYVDIGLDAPLIFGLAAALDLRLRDTEKLSWGFQTTAFQARYRFMNDLTGDPLTMTASLIFRYVSPSNLSDPSCPFHEKWDFEATLSAGKEWSRGPFWLFHTYAFLSFGQGIGGYPWSNAKLYAAYNYLDTWRAALFADGYFGYGNEKTIDPQNFAGYADVAHRSIDVGARLAYHFLIYGLLSLEGTYRVYARAYPEREYAVTLEYRYPFCPL